MGDLKQFYMSQVQTLRAGILHLKHRNRGFIFGEIVSFLAFIGFLAAYTAIDWGATAMVLSLMSLVLYVVIRYVDTRNSERIERLEATCDVYEKELKYLSGDFTCFDDGARYADPKHPFTFDMDIFGRDSLFNRVNRTVTTGGSDYLAECLQRQFGHDGEGIDGINMRREAIGRLAGMETQRVEFMSKGHKGIADTSAILRAVDEINKMHIPSFAVSTVALIVAVLLLTAFFAVIILSIFTPLSGTVPMMWGTIQFCAVFMLCMKLLHNINKMVNSLHGHLKTYIELIRLISTSEMKDIVDPVFKAGDGMQAFEELKKILDGLDRRSSELGLVIFDTFMLNDFFLVRRFAKWRKDGLSAVKQWIDAVTIMDALVSMATFKYNEPQSTDAEVVSNKDIIFEARGLYHPFIGKNAVRNDFSIADGNYYIITGANMAGKSTFLRSLGVNYILAMNGMPVFADSLRVSVFSLFSSMRTTDDLTHGISYFNAELLRLKQLMDECSRNSRTLIILDEILKGTNSLDKLNGSRLFLQEISKYPVSGVIATHDLELSKMCDANPARFHNFCFEIKLSDKITYTYKITSGVARNQNATFLLKNMIIRNHSVDLNQ